MDEDGATVSVGFAIETGTAFAEVLRFAQMFDDKTVEVIQRVAAIEKATGGMMQMGPATTRFSTFANAAARDSQALRREKAQTEKSIEGMIKALDRETLAVGRSREEQRAAKIEALAIAAARHGNTDAADRLLSSTRALDAAQKALAEDKLAAEMKATAAAARERERAEAAVIAQLLERSRLEAAIGRIDGSGRSTAVQAGATFSALAERERALELAEREAAAARQQNNLLAERANLQAALERTTGVGRSKATDNGATFSALAARAADEEARATAMAADSAARLAREHAELAALVRGSQAAMEADAAAAERMRLSTDPLYAAMQRLNAEIAESTRLYHAGATAPAEYARQQEVLVGRMRDVERQHDVVNRSFGTIGTSGKLAGHHMQNLAFQFQDLGQGMIAAAGSSAPMKMALMTMMQQGLQIQGIMSQAGIGIRGVGAAFVTMSKSVLLATVTNPILLGIAAAIGVFAGTVALLTKAANQGNDMKKYAASLGLTAKEIRNLDNVTITWGDTAKAVFQVAGRAIWSAIGPAVTSAWETMKEWAAWIFTGVKSAANFMIGAFVGGYQAIVATWRLFPAALGDLFIQAVNKAVQGINFLIEKSIAGINWMVDQANKILPDDWKLDHVAARAVKGVENQWEGAADNVANVWEKKVGAAMRTDYLGNFAKSAGGAIIEQAAKNARDRTRKQAEEKGYLDPEKGKTDKQAERLERENEAIEAKIRNLYKLADAYRVSGGEALIAEARAKAESDAVKKQGDIEIFVARQVRLAIAERVVDSAKAVAVMRDQAVAQEAVNAMVAAGLVPAERAADLVRDRIADLPLLAAIEAAQKVKDLQGVAQATKALDDQRAARERLTKAESDARYNSAMKGGKDRLAEMREELRLIGATEEARARAMGEFRARQDASIWTDQDPQKIAEYVRLMGDIAVQGVLNAQAQDAYNASLTETADRWDIIAQKVQSAAQGMSDAFGTVGQAIGDIATIYAGYHAARARAEAEHQAAITKAGSNEKLLAQENARYALRSTGAQIAMYGDMASAAKGFFAEGSKGWKALQAAEQVYRAVQMAMSLRAMVQNALETAGVVTNAAVKATAEGTAGIASQSKLPFPFNIAAMAATAAALVAAGVAVFAGGGGSNTLPKANDGTGTVLGDSSAKSDSIKNAIDALKDIDTLMLNTSRQMAASLRSIEDQIGGVASLVVRAGNVNASAGVAEGFKPNFIGSVLGKIPLIGGLLGGLFGSTTSVVGSGLYAGPQSLGSILGGGFDASYYSDVKKTSKFLGIKTGTSYSTRYTGADAGLETQFALVLREFNDAIIAAAGPLGAATGEIEARLRGFVINIGKIDLQGLTGAQIEEKLNAVFGAAADNMANAAFPSITRFQLVGEGAFETLVRVASTVETVTAALDQLGAGTVALGIDAKMGLASQFDSLSDLTNAVSGYFDAFYTKEEQAAARAAQFGRVFDSLGLTMPSTLAAFRQLVEAQDLTTAAGQATYATLLQLAPAFAELQSSLAGAKSAADIASERTDLQRQILQLQGDTKALRALDLAKIDPSNRALQQQVWALADAQDAAKNAQALADAWKSVGNSIMDEVKRIRGATGADGGGSFASIMGQFNAATTAARTGDQDAAKSLPSLSQALLKAAADAATSRQELDRIRAQTAASLEATYGVISALTRPSSTSATNSAAVVDVASLQATPTTPANDDTAAAIDQLRGDLDATRKELSSALVAIAGNTGKAARVLDSVTQQSGGNALSIVQSA